jgi:hypothetical protein
MTDACRDLLDQQEPKDLTQIALQMLFTIERMELIIPEITDTIRKALEQGRPAPQPPADGEVAELVEWLRERATWCAVDDPSHKKYDRAADLLQHPQPVAVSERLPGPGDCDEQGRCWMFGNVEGDWRLISTINPGIPKLKYCFSHWLPASALPTPETTNA